MSPSEAANEAAVPVQLQLVATPGDTPTVADAKRLVTACYPKLYSRFNHAFHGQDDTAQLMAAVDAVTANVDAWLAAMPDNFKTSTHALSRPKFGLVFVLKHDLVREALGEAWCATAVSAIERGWKLSHNDHVAPKPLLPPSTPGGTAGLPGEGCDDGTNESLKEKYDELLERSLLLERALVQLLEKNYDEYVCGLVSSLLSI
jgi:hypothetical protein